jgi:hypothetical protein
VFTSRKGWAARRGVPEASWQRELGRHDRTLRILFRFRRGFNLLFSGGHYPPLRALRPFVENTFIKSNG